MQKVGWQIRILGCEFLPIKLHILNIVSGHKIRYSLGNDNKNVALTDTAANNITNICVFTVHETDISLLLVMSLK